MVQTLERQTLTRNDSCIKHHKKNCSVYSITIKVFKLLKNITELRTACLNQCSNNFCISYLLILKKKKKKAVLWNFFKRLHILPRIHTHNTKSGKTIFIKYYPSRSTSILSPTITNIRKILQSLKNLDANTDQIHKKMNRHKVFIRNQSIV